MIIREFTCNIKAREPIYSLADFDEMLLAFMG
jgi:hypothetical protein